MKIYVYHEHIIKFDEESSILHKLEKIEEQLKIMSEKEQELGTQLTGLQTSL